MVGNHVRDLDLYGQVVWWVYKRFRSSEGFCSQDRLSAPVPLSSDWSVFERQEAITMHVA